MPALHEMLEFDSQAELSLKRLDARTSDSETQEVSARLFAEVQQTGSDRNTASSGTISLQEVTQKLAETAKRLHDAKVPEFKSDKNLERFQENMALFSKRAQDKGFSEADIKETYSQILRLLDPKQDSTAVGERERMMLAQQVLREAASPSETVGLGKHFTCSAQAVEERIYLLKPWKAAKLVADIALNNQFVTADGTTITIDPDSLKPDEESKVNPPAEGQRGYASHIFAMTALNIHWNRVKVDPRGNEVELGSFRFAQMPKHRGDRYKMGEPYFDRGERLIDMRTTPPTIIADGPLIDISFLPDMHKQITGSDESGFVAENKNGCAEPSICVDSSESLQSVLAATKERGAFPLLLRIHTGNDEFIDADNTGDWHVVSILDFNAAKKEAFVSDQAGKRWDKFMKVDKLYRATMDPPVRFRPLMPLQFPKPPGQPQNRPNP